MPSVLTAAASERQQARVAGALRRHGLGEGDRVVLSVSGSEAYASVVLGATRSGVVPVPLDPRLTAYERERILHDVRPSLVVDDQDALRALLEGDPAPLDPWPRCRPMHFTSGTTGRPKGVWSGLLPSDHAEALVREERELWRFGPADVHVAVAPLYHSAPLRFATATLLAGGSVVVLPRFDAADVVEAVQQHAPTTTFCAPAHLQRLLAHLDETGADLDVSSFRLVAHAGAPCPEPLRRRVHDLFGRETVWEFYGSTEGQITACRADDWHAHPGTVGRARPGRVVTVDEDGLLWCSVPPWARFSYWDDPDKTARSWRETADGPAFTVGDLGRVDDGWVHLDSRREDLIISGGVNVYPAEVESALASAQGLVDVVVVGRPDEQWGQRVSAVYVGEVDEQELRDLAAQRLAPAKRPKTYERVASLPRTGSGKVRRRDL